MKVLGGRPRTARHMHRKSRRGRKVVAKEHGSSIDSYAKLCAPRSSAVKAVGVRLPCAGWRRQAATRLLANCRQCRRKVGACQVGVWSSARRITRTMRSAVSRPP